MRETKVNTKRRRVTAALAVLLCAAPMLAGAGGWQGGGDDKSACKHGPCFEVRRVESCAGKSCLEAVQGEGCGVSPCFTLRQAAKCEGDRCFQVFQIQAATRDAPPAPRSVAQRDRNRTQTPIMGDAPTLKTTVAQVVEQAAGCRTTGKCIEIRQVKDCKVPPCFEAVKKDSCKGKDCFNLKRY